MRVYRYDSAQTSCEGKSSRNEIATVVLLRIDNRLIHGQVALAWTPALGADCILVANDAAAHDPLRRSMLKLACPQGVKLVVKTVDDAIAALTSGVTDRYTLFIVTESIEDAHRIVSRCPGISTVNIGGCRESAQTVKRLSAAVPVTEGDVDLIRDLIAKGIEVEIRQVPSDCKVDVSELI